MVVSGGRTARLVGRNYRRSIGKRPVCPQVSQVSVTVEKGPIITPPDLLDPSSRLINVKPIPLPTPTTKSYSCTAIARELGFQSGSPQNLAALRILYQTSCR